MSDEQNAPTEAELAEAVSQLQPIHGFSADWRGFSWWRALVHERVKYNRAQAELELLMTQRDELVARTIGPADPTDLPLGISIDNQSPHGISVNAIPLYGRVLATGEVRGPIRIRVNVWTTAPSPLPEIDPRTRLLRDLSDDALAWRLGDAVITRDWENLAHYAVEYRERTAERAQLVTPLAAIAALRDQDQSTDDEWNRGWNEALAVAIVHVGRLEDLDAPWRCSCAVINYDKRTRCYACGTEREAAAMGAKVPAVVYQCPRCATSMQPDASAKPVPTPSAPAAPAATLGMPSPVIMRTLLTMMTPGTELHAIVAEHAKRRRETAAALSDIDYTFPTEETSEYPPRGVACWHCCEENWTRDARIIVCCESCGAYLHQSNPKSGTNPWCPFHGDPPDRCLCDLPDMTPGQEIAIWREWAAKAARDPYERDGTLEPKDIAVNVLFDAARSMLDVLPETDADDDEVYDAVRDACTGTMNTSVVGALCTILVEMQDQARLDAAEQAIQEEKPS